MRYLPGFIATIFLCLPTTAVCEPALTIYNNNFAVVREKLPLNLKKGRNETSFNNITAHLEPGSVILRNPLTKQKLQIVEQRYLAEPVSQGLLLSLNEGKAIDFLVSQQGADKIVPGKIIRSGYVPHLLAMQSYGPQYAERQSSYGYGESGQPIIEVEGKVRFGLPGIPLFPKLTDDAVLKPVIEWRIDSDEDEKIDAELSYVTGGMRWLADYNAVTPKKGSSLDLTGWVTIENQTGKDFADATIKLVAGDVSKLQQDAGRDHAAAGSYAPRSDIRPPVSGKEFDEYYLYSLKHRTALRDRESKQVEFIRAAGIQAKQRYIYDGVKIDEARYQGYNQDSILREQNYGIVSNPKVWVICEFKNSESNGLGQALPKGRLRFYRQDDNGQLELTGENSIDHTPKDEMLHIYTGNAFDIVGERRRTDYKLDHSMLNESFEIRLRNHKKEEVEITVVEHLYRWFTWQVTQESSTHLKTESQTIEYLVQVPPGGEKVITYSVQYTW